MSKNPKNQNFGGEWTVEKMEAVSRYLDAYTQALKNQSFNKVYIDAFAGSGLNLIGTKKHNILIDGSAVRAMQIQIPFDHYYFVESDDLKCQTLSEICQSRFAHLKYKIIATDANESLYRVCTSDKIKNVRAVLFLDPYGASVSWNTLEAVAATEKFDVWYLFPINAVARFAAHDPDKVVEEKLDFLFGGQEWRGWYAPTPESNELQRNASMLDMLGTFEKKLQNIFPLVLPPAILENQHGKPLYALFFMCSSHNPSARETAKKIASHIFDMKTKGRLAQELKAQIKENRHKAKLDAQMQKRRDSGVFDLFDSQD